jgi:hypothetical protein
MLGLSGVIACVTPKLIRVDALAYSHVRRFQGLCWIRDRVPACERMKIYNGVRGPIRAAHVAIRILMRARDLLFPQHIANHGAQLHRVHRLVQQMITAGAGLTQQLWTGVAADQESRNLGGKFPA